MATITMYNDINVDDAFSPIFSAVGYGVTNALSTADTTTTWSARTLPSASNWNSVCYGNKMIVAVSGSTTAGASSPDGITWTARTLPASAVWQSVAFGGGRFVAVANGSTSSGYSTDGIAWTSGGALPGTDQWFCLAYGESRFVAVSTGASTAAAYSTNGTSWTSATLPASANWQSVCYGNGKFIAVSYGSTAVAQSDDGTTWTSAGSMPTSRNWSSVTWGNPGNTANGIFVAVAYGTAVGAISTDNGANWTEVSLAPDVVVNGSFTGNADGWTLGAGWTYGSDMVTHAASGGTATVVPNPALTIVASTIYEVKYTISGRTAGTVTMRIGNTAGAAQSTNATFTEVVTSANTSNLSFTPTTDFDGSIDDISVRYGGNWNCISYGVISAQGVRVFTVTPYGGSATNFNTVSFDGTNWFLRAVSTFNWKYHCFAPIAWNSGDTLVIQNNAVVTVNTDQTKFWKTITGTYGQLSIQNTSTSTPINFFMGRSSAATVNAITPGSGAFSIDIDGNWIELGTGDGTADQEFTAPYSEYVPSLWVETGSGTGVYEVWNNVTGTIGPYMHMFGRTGLEWVGNGHRGDYFIQNAASNPLEIFSLTSGATITASFLVTCASTTGVLAGGLITGTGIPANTVVNRVVDSTTLELSAVATATNSSLTFTLYNPIQAQYSTTVVFGDGTNGNVVPNGAKVRVPNIMLSDNTSAFLKNSSYLVDASIVMINGGLIDARICLFGDIYVDLRQAASVYFRNVGFDYQWELSECYAVDMDYVGCSATPTYWYYSAQWIIRINQWGVVPPFGYTTPAGSNNVIIAYIHNASIKNWHKVVFCTGTLVGTNPLTPVELSDTEDATFENVRLVQLLPTRTLRTLNISGRVNGCTFTNLQLFGSSPLNFATSNNNTFTGLEYALTMTQPIVAFKTGMRLSENADGTLLADDVPVFIKTRTFFTWNSRETYFESGEYSATPFQNNWLFPDTISIRPTETVPASVTFNWTQREPSAAVTTAYEIHRSTTQGFTARDTTTAVFRVATPATVAYVNGPRTSSVSSAARIFTFATGKTITASGTPGSFTTDGHAVGDVVEITGTASNDGTYTINTLTATVMTVNEILVAEVADDSPVATIAGKPPVVNTPYYYRMRKFHSITAKGNISGASGTSTLTTAGTGVLSFDNLYSTTEFFYDSGATVIRNRKINLFATPFYKGAKITGTGIQADTTILSIDAAGRELVISKPTTAAATNATIVLPVQAGMAVLSATLRPGAGLPYGTTVVSVESSTSLTISNALPADLCTISVVNGSFTGNATGWTLNAGWSYASDAISHSSGTGTFLQATPLVAVIGTAYTIAYTITNSTTTGTVTASFGGASGTARTANGYYVETVIATTTGNLIFTPTTTFNGTMDDISIAATVSFLPFTESPELVCTPHNYTSATNYCLQSRTLGTTWVASNVTVTSANTFAAPTDLLWATPATSSRLVSSSNGGTVTQTITGLTISNVYSASIWVRANQTAALPTGVAGTLRWGSGGGQVNTGFTATNEWQKINAYNFTATATSHDIVIIMTTTGQTIWVADVMVTDGATTTATITTTTTQVTLLPRAIPITTLYSYNRPVDMTGSTGHQGIHVTFGTAPAGAYYHEVYLSTTSGFTPSDSTMVARTWVLGDLSHFAITTSQFNNFSDIVKLPGGGCSTPGAGIFALTANSNNNAFVNCDIDYTYCNVTALPALHLVTPSQNNVFHNVDFGRNANYLLLSGLWHNTASNSVTGNRVQNIFADHYDLPVNNQSLSSKFKGVAGGSSYPVATATTYILGANTIDGVDVAKTAAYGSMFNEYYRGRDVNKVINGSFDGSASGWTLNSGWTYGSGVVTHASGTGTLIPNPALTVVAGLEYEITYTVSGRTAGSVTMSIGGTSGTARSTNGTFTEKLTTTTTGNLTFTPTNTFDGSLDNISASEVIGALHVVFEDTQGVKPYTTTGSPKFSNTGRLFLPTVSDTVTLTWPHKIKGVAGFAPVVPRLVGVALGNNTNLLDGLKIEYKINAGSFTRLTPQNLVAEGVLNSVDGFDFQLKLTPQTFLTFSTATVGTYTRHTTASPGVITTNATVWATGQRVLYTTTSTPFGGLTNETFYYLIVVSTTTFQLSTTQGGGGIALSADPGTGVHTFQTLFEVGETILGAISFATAEVAEVYYDTTLTGTLVLTNVVGSWVPGESIRTGANNATKGLNVATNGFALGPAFTSNINALEIFTYVDRSKLYDAAIVTVTLTNIIPDSRYYIYNTDTSEQIASGTATGTPGPGESTIDYNVSVVYESDFEITVNVRKSSAPVKYLPYESGSTVTSTGANVFIAQVADTVVIDSYGAIASDWTVNETLKTIKHTSGSTVYTVKQLYSWLLDYFDELGYLDDEVPMAAPTPTEYTLINGWFINDLSFTFLSGGAVTSIGQANEIQLLKLDGVSADPVVGDIGKQVRDDGVSIGPLLDYAIDPYGANTGKWWVRTGSGTAIANNSAMTILTGTGAGDASAASVDGESIWSNIYTLGSLIAGTTLDVYQEDVQITPWWTSGQIDILVKVSESGVEIDSGNLTVLARLYGTLYDHFVIDASSGRNPVPLVAFTDNNNQTASGTVGAYAGFTFDFGYTTKDLGNGNGLQPYDVVIDCNSHTIQETYEYLKYVTRTGSATTLNGVNGEFYTGVGDVRFNYDNELSGPFVEGELITGTGSVYGYLVSLLDSGTTGTMVLRNVHGTFTDNMALTGGTSTATSQVDGSVTTITPQKQAPFGSLAGGQFFGAQGVWLENVASADANNYQLIDSTGTTQSPPVSITVKVVGVASGDRVSMFRATVDGTIDKSVFTSHATSNTSGNGTFVIQGSITADTPATGNLRVVHRSGTGATISEQSYAYTSWTGSTFTLSGTLSMTYSGDDTTYVPYIDVQASSTTVTISTTYPGVDRDVITRVRKKGIIPFTISGTIESTGLTVTVTRTDDTIVV